MNRRLKQQPASTEGEFCFFMLPLLSDNSL
jgi:hypothetical protein